MTAPCPDGNTACDGSILLHGEWCKRGERWADLCAATARLGAAFAQFKNAMDAYASVSPEGEA
jgi:hypothetical protein